MPKGGKKGGGKGWDRGKSNQPPPQQTEPVSDDAVSETDVTTRDKSKKANKKKAAVWSKQSAKNSEPESFSRRLSISCSSVSAATSHRVTASPLPNMTVAFYVDVFYVGPALVVAFLCLAAEQLFFWIQFNVPFKTISLISRRANR